MNIHTFTVLSFTILAPQQVTELHSELPRAHITFLPGNEAARLLNYFTAPPYPTVSGPFSSPLETELLAMLDRLPGFLAEKSPHIRSSLDHYYLQIASTVQRGERLLLINAFHDSALADFPEWKTELVLVRDGGNSFWRVQYSVQNGTFKNFYVNGKA